MTYDKIYRIFSNIPTLKTDRLTLRKITPDDQNDVFEYSSDPMVSKYLLWYPHKDPQYTREYLQRIKNDYRIGKYYDWGIVYSIPNQKGKMIGTCGFTSFDFYNNSAEVGYVLNRSYWGLGVAREALSSVIEFGFEKLFLHRIEANYIIGNDRSRKVMERCGMSFEGIRRSSMIVKGEYRDIGVYSLISDEYYKRKNHIPNIDAD